MNTHKILRARVHAAAGLFDPPARMLTVDELEKSEWSPEFEAQMRRIADFFGWSEPSWSLEFLRLMRNRLIMGALRYSTMAVKKLKPHRWDLVEPIGRKIRWYLDTGNTEALVDAANYLLLEFEVGYHATRCVGGALYMDSDNSNLENVMACLRYYLDFGDATALAQAGHCLMLEYLYGHHANKHFEALDDAGGHCKQKK